MQAISTTTLAGVSAKRVMLYRFDRQPAEGFVTTARFDLSAQVEIMSLDGNLQCLSYAEVKAMCFISESGPANLFSEHTTFERRPKIPGLWTRFELRDGDHLDGVLSHSLAEWPEAGFLAIPPRAGSLRQRVFLPRLALTGTELRGIIGKPLVPGLGVLKARPAGQFGDDQLKMFD